MTVLIVSTFGATKNYPDQSMMRVTLDLFLNSLRRQTDPGWRLFISCHDKPSWIQEEDRIRWCSVACDATFDCTLVAKKLPEMLTDPVEYVRLGYESKIADMGRKTYNSVIQAGLWAYRFGVKNFWMLRMDSDDLLDKDHVAFLNALNTKKVRAVFNRKCFIYDPRLREVGVYDYRNSTTCNALFMEIEGSKLPNWFYHCTDHTTFARTVRHEGIPWRERDWALCITTNSGNSISESRGRIVDNREATIIPVTLTAEIRDRYGLDGV